MAKSTAESISKRLFDLFTQVEDTLAEYDGKSGIGDDHTFALDALREVSKKLNVSNAAKGSKDNADVFKKMLDRLGASVRILKNTGGRLYGMKHKAQAPKDLTMDVLSILGDAVKLLRAARKTSNESAASKRRGRN